MVQEQTTTTGLSPTNLAYLCQIVYQESGIVLDDSKRYLLEARLKPVAQQHGLASIDQLCSRIQLDHDRALRAKVVEGMTTNETLFFRDVTPFDALKQTILPELTGRRADLRRLSIWCAACSSGQEPYSLAMLLLETIPQPHLWKIEILGTDIAEGILDRARRARYFQLEVNRGLPVHYLVKYFRREHLDWELKAEIRNMVQFKMFNLKDPMRGMGPFDIVMCRNVMIYFDTTLKKQILTGIRGVLAPDGYLLMGAAETVYNLDENYERKVIGPATVYTIKR